MTTATSGGRPIARRRSCWPFGPTPLTGAVLASVVAACPAYAQSVLTCDADTQLDLVAAPYDINVRHFANGAVMVAIVDDNRDEVATALSVLVLSPPLDAQGMRQCRRVAATQTDGYAALVLDTAAASYDPATGLTVQLPGLVVSAPNSLGDDIVLGVTINQATGDITPVQKMDSR